jgi:tetratricopeptide (TPR) repeat protein
MKQLLILRTAQLATALAPILCEAQQASLSRADRLYEEFSFAEAILRYERALEQGVADTTVARRLAECYYNVRDLSRAEKWYAVIAQMPSATATDLVHYTEALRANAKYAEADSILSHHATDPHACDLARNRELYGLLLVDPLLEGDLATLPWNSSGLDLSPAFCSGKIVFASTRPPTVGKRRKHAWDGQAYLHLYLHADGEAMPLKAPTNTNYHRSDPAFSADGTVMYFTRNNSRAENHDDHHATEKHHGEAAVDHATGSHEDDARPEHASGTEAHGSDANTSHGDAEASEHEAKNAWHNLMIASWQLINGVWTNETTFPYNSPAFSTGHPCLTADGLTIYFSSNRPGGFGGVDIWKCNREPGGEWHEPVNLGPKVNTPGNEMFPRVFGDHALFFSSDGHVGLGGLDVLLTWDMEDGPSDPMNVGAPINSRADDMSLVLTDDGRTGYFSSDRKGGAGGADIYQVLLDEPVERRMRITSPTHSADNDRMHSTHIHDANMSGTDQPHTPEKVVAATPHH